MTSYYRFVRLLCSSVLVALLAACAHPINIEPGTAPTRDAGALISRKVAYVMTDADRAKQVTTEGGGGDKISYFPYRDLEKSIREALRSVYQDVIVLRSVNDAKSDTDASTLLVFAPEISTTSSSPSMLTWPPTRFSVEYVCTVTDAKGDILARIRAVGTGAAEWDEFKGDFALAAKRASTEATKALAAEIRGNAKLR